MRWRHVLRVYRDPDQAGPVQDEEGNLVGGAGEPELVLSAIGDLQDGMRRRTGDETGPFGIPRDADFFPRDESLVRGIRQGMAAEVDWLGEEGRSATAVVVGTRELDGVVRLDWTSRTVLGEPYLG